MSMTRTNSVRRTGGDYFEPDDAVDPKAHRHLRGLLEQIDYTAYTANRQVLAGALGDADAQKFQRLATATAVARARWVATALAATDGGRPPSRAQIDEIARERMAYEELTEAYDALRRMVERGYLAYPAAE
ncbi:hypothetical protein [Phenylobacterium sp.]|uniref:hypothetical protein n=1 Tax=Phenylobacterium sp. TaxID=1871053 RepID=UPI0025F3A193|nr:hypothetical protein [Phenylobacterium sp.]